MFGVTPAISVFGVVGNIFSIIVLIKRGMRKCSNILLVSLAFSDITFLISFNSVPKIIYEAVWNHEYVGYSRKDTDILFITFNIFTVFDYSFGMMGLTIPMLITLERIVVIFFPLNFRRIITPRRTWLSVAGVAVFWVSVVAPSCFWLEVSFTVDPYRNISTGIIQRTTSYHQNLAAVSALEDLIIFTCYVIPLVFTVLGSLVISVKVRVHSAQRKKLTSGRGSGNRTTKTLLAVCTIYTVTTAFYTLPLYVPQYASSSLTDESPTNMGKIYYQIANIVLCVNGSSNFVVYVALNKTFRDTYKGLFKRSR
ncbi:unnamed protein product, partial [Lymnaea stagnalis]